MRLVLYWWSWLCLWLYYLSHGHIISSTIISIYNEWFADFFFRLQSINRYEVELWDAPACRNRMQYHWEKFPLFRCYQFIMYARFFCAHVSDSRPHVFRALGSCCCSGYLRIFVLFTFSLLYFSCFIVVFFLFVAAYHRFCCWLLLLCWQCRCFYCRYAKLSMWNLNVCRSGGPHFQLHWA